MRELGNARVSECMGDSEHGTAPARIRSSGGSAANASACAADFFLADITSALFQKDDPDATDIITVPATHTTPCRATLCRVLLNDHAAQQQECGAETLATLCGDCSEPAHSPYLEDMVDVEAMRDLRVAERRLFLHRVSEGYDA